jgi:DUF4097 and DUF4098 domain-containing protein YvlB
MHIISPARIGWLFATWWPLLLIVLGLVRIVEYSVARSQGNPAPRFGGGAVFLLILVILVGVSASTARRVNWQAFGNDFDVNPGIDTMWGQKYDFTDEVQQALPAGGSLQIDSDHGSVTVHVSESSDDPVKLVVHRHIAADSQDAANKFHDQQKATLTTEGNVLRVNSGQHGPNVQIGFSMGPRSVSDMEIWAPRKAPVQVTAAHGDINVAERDANVKVSTTHGDVQVSQVKGNVSVAGHKGDIQIHQVTGDVEISGRLDDVTISEVSGALKLNGEFFGDTKLSQVGRVQFGSSRTQLDIAKLTGDLEMGSDDLRVSSGVGPFVLHTKAKDIHVEDISGPVNIENSHGEIEVHPKSPFGDISISNHQGAIHVVLPDSAGFNIDARSSRGELESDFPLTINQQGEDHVAQGNLGKGGSKLQLTTDHGLIEVRKG